MSDGGVPLSWKNTLYRYIWGPGLALVLMIVATVAALGIDTRVWREDDTVFQTDPEGSDWQPYSPERLASLRQEANTTILVHIVATWADGSNNNRIALCASPTIAAKVSAGSLKLLLADHSQRPVPIATLLASLDDPPLPLVLLYPPKSDEPTLLAGPITETLLKEKLFP